MKRVISASRRTDLVASFPDWLSAAVEKERARVSGPAGFTYSVDLSPEAVHTFVFWSKNFENLIDNRFSLQKALRKYAQLYFHFTITGLGGTFIERNAPSPQKAVLQLDPLIKLAGSPQRVSLRFDPVVFWEEGRSRRTNLNYFEKLAPELSARGIKDVRFSFTQWYGKARRRALKYGFKYIDPPEKEKLRDARYLGEIAANYSLNLFSCSQDFLTAVPGVKPSACIDGALLSSLHPDKAHASAKKDKSQRQECRCTDSVDIGSYTQACPHGCIYCYANPII